LKCIPVGRVSTLLVAVALVAGLVGCVPAQYNLTISTTEGGEVTTPGKGTFNYDEGAVVPLVVFPHTGYDFVSWTGDVDTIGNVSAASTTIAMHDDYSITARFAAKHYDLIVSSTDGGSVSRPGEGTFSYDGGVAVNLVAAPDSGYQFVNWSGNVHTIADVNAASVTITMGDDYSVIANFEAIPPTQYTLTISSTEGGGVTTPGEGTFRYAAGTVVDLVAASEEGYKFFKWTGDIEMIADVDPRPPSTAHNQPPRRFSITMEGDYAITANFIIRWIPLDKIGPGP
jgi:uncharacterized repeat protein (TIGR02543 family)